MGKDNRNIKIVETLNRDKVLDEAIFLAICGRNKIKDGDRITSTVRLQMAVDKLQRCIARLHSELK